MPEGVHTRGMVVHPDAIELRGVPRQGIPVRIARIRLRHVHRAGVASFHFAVHASVYD